MKTTLALLFLCMLTAADALAQGKGVDQQNDRIRDGSTNRAPAVNGGNQDVGTGRGIDFGGGRTETPPPIPNPYRLAARRDAVVEAVREQMAERKLILDDAVSRPEEGVLISQPYTFSRGAVVTPNELGRLAELPQTEARSWTRGRYTLVVEIQPIDGLSTNVSVNARLEGRSEGATGAEWVSLRSLGAVEQEFLLDLITRITGGPPTGREPQ